MCVPLQKKETRNRLYEGAVNRLCADDGEAKRRPFADLHSVDPARRSLVRAPCFLALLGSLIDAIVVGQHTRKRLWLRTHLETCNPFGNIGREVERGAIVLDLHSLDVAEQHSHRPSTFNLHAFASTCEIVVKALTLGVVNFHPSVTGKLHDNGIDGASPRFIVRRRGSPPLAAWDCS